MPFMQTIHNHYPPAVSEAPPWLDEIKGRFSLALIRMESLMVDVSRLVAIASAMAVSEPKLLAALQASRDQNAQLASQLSDISAKLAAAPSEDPTVQPTIDGVVSQLTTN